MSFHKRNGVRTSPFTFSPRFRAVLSISIISMMFIIGLAQMPVSKHVERSASDQTVNKVWRCDGQCRTSGGIERDGQAASTPEGQIFNYMDTNPEAESRSGTNQYAVLVGIDDYPGTGNDLSECINDVNKIRNKLVNDYGWTAINIKIVTDSQATHSGVINALDWLAQQADNGSQTWFSFSGHGTSGVIVLYDQDMTDTTIASKIQAIAAKEKVVELDSCFAGSNTALQGLQNTITLAACGGGELSGDGVFTPALTSKMTANKALETAFGEAKTTTASMTGGGQNPVMWDNIAGNLYLDDRAPTIVGTVPDFTAAEDTPIIMHLTLYESDDRDSGTALKWTVDSVDPVVIASVQGEKSADDTITINPVKDFNGYTTVKMVLTDSRDKNATQFVRLTWTPVNDAPTVTNITSASPSVMRTATVKLTLAGMDPEETPNGLVGTAEWKSPGGTWSPLPAISLKGTVWQVDFTPSATDEMGLYSMRAQLTDSQSAVGEWTTINNLVTVKNNPPVVSEISYSSEIVERGDDVTIMVSGSDVESQVALLECRIEFKTPVMDWTVLPVDVTYDDELGMWKGIFTPLISSDLGEYGIRASLKDGDMETGPWLFKNSSIEIRNSRPKVDDLVLPAPPIIYRANATDIYVLGHDLEDPQANLICEVEYRYSNGTDRTWVQDEDPIGLDWDRWLFLMELGTEAQTGPYDLRARLTDTFGEPGDWSYFNGSVTVLNNPPTITSFTASSSSVLRSSVLTMEVVGSDVEDENHMLTIGVEYRNQADAGDEGAWNAEGITNMYDSAQARWTLEFTPPTGLAPGTYDMEANLVDKDGTVGPVNRLVIVVENNLPDVLYTYPNPINAGEVTVFDASKTTDVETPVSGLEFEWTFGDGSTGKGARVEHTYKQHGAIKLTLNVKDGDGGTSVKDMTEVINALPDIQVTANQAAGGYQVQFQASGKDPDGKILEYRWDFDANKDSNNDGNPANDVDSSSKNPSHTYPGPGTYKVRLTVVDDRGGTEEVTKAVTVTTFSLGMGTGSFIFSALALLMVLLVIAAVAFMVMRKRKGRVNTGKTAPSPHRPWASPPPSPSSKGFGSGSAPAMDHGQGTVEGYGPVVEYDASVNIAREYGGPIYPAQEYYPDRDQGPVHDKPDEGNGPSTEPDSPPEPDAVAKLWQESQDEE